MFPCTPRVVYYNKPTTASSVTVTPKYLKRGSKIKTTWSGISSKSLAYVQYRLAKCDASGNETGTVVNYSGSTKLGTAGSGSATVAASSGWGDGIYKIVVRGVDNGGIAGVGKGCGFYIDGTAPAMNQPVIKPASSAASPADNLTPTVTWSGVSDANLQKIECSVNNGAFVSLGTAASGSYQIPSGKITGNGEHTITLRAVDKAGNVKSYTLKYYLNKYGLGFEGYIPESGSLKIRKEYGKNILSWKTKSELSDSVYYRIYRGESENFKADASTLAADNVEDSYWVDIRSVSDKKYYYKAEVVRVNTEDEIEGRTFLTPVLSIEGTRPEALTKKTGSKNYLGYHEFSTPTGNGSIETSGGNLSYSQEDVTLPSNQLAFDVTRNYNSQLSLTGMFGTGWMDSLHKELILDSSGKIYFLDSDGSVYGFEKSGGAYRCKETKDYTLQSEETAVPLMVRAVREVTALGPAKEDTKGGLSSSYMGESAYVIKGESAGSKPGSGNIGEMGGAAEIIEVKAHAYTVKTKDGVLYRFDKDGQLIAAIEPNGTFLLYDYGPDGRLSSVQTGAGKKISLTYSAENGLLQSVSLPDGTALSYTYGGGTLTQAAHVSKDKKESRTFRYGYTGGYLSSVTDGKGQAYTIGYQGEKAEKITYPNQESDQLTYQTGSTSVTKKNESGTEICTTVTEYDAQTGKTLKETDAGGDVTAYEYGFADNPYLVTKTKKTVGYETITDGKVEFKTEEKVTETTYNADENVKSETAEDGTVTTYNYDTTSEWTKDSPGAVNAEINGTAISKETTEYDAKGNALKETDATDASNKSITVNVYDDDGNLLESTVTEDGMEVSKSVCTYDDDGNILYEKEVSADTVSEEKNTYDRMGRPLKTTDETTGQVTEYTYDYLGRTIKTAVTLNGKTQTSTASYDGNGTVVKETDTAGITTEYQYDSINRVTERKVTKGDSITYKTAYSYGDVTVRDGLKERTIKNASIEKESYPDGTTSSEKYYDKDGKVVKEKAGGLYTDYTYDKSGNQTAAYSGGTETEKADGKVTLTLYDEKGNQTATVINPSVENGSYAIGKDTIVAKKQYDDKGNVVKETDAKGTATEYTYDDSGRVTQVMQDAGGEKIATKAEYTTDAAGGTTSITITDAKGHTSVEVRDAAGLIRSAADHGDNAQESIATAYEYDSRGNQTKTTYENDAYKTFTYDERNLLTKTELYSSDGKQTLQTDYAYDDQYRQTKMTDSRMKDGKLVPYRYTLTGYDGFGRTAWSAEVNAESEPSEEVIASHKITYSYDAEDKVTGIRYALVKDGGVAGLEYVYDGNRWLTGIRAVIKGRDEKPLIREYTYDAQGKVAEIKEYPGLAGNVCITKTYSYDNLDRVTSMVYKKGSEVLESYASKYDKNNQITEKTEINNTPKTEQDKVNLTKTYTYNALGQLTKTEVTDHKDGDKKETITYEYDKAGNRTKKGKGSAQTSYTYNGLDQLLTAVTERDGEKENTVTYEYDVNGNQVKESDTKNHVTTVNEYDADNRLSKAVITMPSAEALPEPVQEPASEAAQGTESADNKESTDNKDRIKTVTQENLYNGNGQRIKKSEGAKETNYFYQDGVVSYTTEGSGDTKAIQNLLGLEDNIIMAEYASKISGETAPESAEGKEAAADSAASEEVKSDSFRYYLYNKDIQGSTTSVLNEDGAGELSYEYDDFGETKINGSSAFQNEICYTGGIYDETTGLYYLNARYYDPENGRFLTEDTYRGEMNEPDTLHLYVYCKNNPINYVDPSGHIAVEVALLYYAGAAIVSAGLVLYYSNMARIRGKLVYIYKERPAKKKKYSAKAVMPKAGASIKKKVNINKSKSKVKSGTASKKASKKSKKERATEIPSWAQGSEPRKGESGKQYAKRKMDEHYGKNGWRRKGKQASEYSQLKKWGDRGRK